VFHVTRVFFTEGILQTWENATDNRGKDERKEDTVVVSYLIFGSSKSRVQKQLPRIFETFVNLLPKKTKKPIFTGSRQAIFPINYLPTA
jgi:hypothetical protein